MEYLGPQHQQHRRRQHADDRPGDGLVGGRPPAHRAQQAAGGAERVVRAMQGVVRVRDRLALAVQVGQDGDAQFLQQERKEGCGRARVWAGVVRGRDAHTAIA